ncbi:MAG: hypothetical protein IT373_38340 [Polyangiaceae bacterium]|nr:hypothetical protein [Polyangiaceae bacterium]
MTGDGLLGRRHDVVSRHDEGAPLRLRVERQLGYVRQGYKMAKWVERFERVESFDSIGKGQGGRRDDLLDD